MSSFQNHLSRYGILVVSLIISTSVVFFTLLFYPSHLEYSQETVDYAVKVDQFEVCGNSMAPLIKSGQIVNLFREYYDFHPVERGDIVLYDYAGNDAPIIKIVKAVPGDNWRIEKDEDKNSYQIIVNGEPLKNSEGRYYQISESKIKMLENYAESYPVLQSGTYLILGNKIRGSMDATRFGLIGKNDILGKVEVCQ